MADGTGLAAIQCKFYSAGHTIQKTDIDTFISAASNDIFRRLVIVDTTNTEFGRNANVTDVLTTLRSYGQITREDQRRLITGLVDEV